jgi:hypothetical protein
LRSVDYFTLHVTPSSTICNATDARIGFAPGVSPAFQATLSRITVTRAAAPLAARQKRQIILSSGIPLENNCPVDILGGAFSFVRLRRAILNLWLV